MIFSVALSTPLGHAQSLLNLHSFSGPDGAAPSGGMLIGRDGTLYGTTANGGNGSGTVFSLIYQAGTGTWAETILHTFSGPDGQNPSSRLTYSNGALFGTAAGGGKAGQGTAFAIGPPVSGTEWRFATLYDFQSAGDGASPFAGLVADSSGNLYGATTYGGIPNCATGAGCGTVFRLSQSGSGHPWVEDILYRFQPDRDGTNPSSDLVLAPDGTLYGNTSVGGVYGNGAIFSLSPAEGGAPWTEALIYSFKDRRDGIQPTGGLALGRNGPLYGTTMGGGSFGCGTVFELIPPLNGSPWTKSILHDFGCSDGAYPQATVLLKPGIVFGTTSGGGSTGGGTVFAVAAPAVSGNAWTFYPLYDFQLPSNGANPAGRLSFGADNTVVGTTLNGGSGNQGTVFALFP